MSIMTAMKLGLVLAIAMPATAPAQIPFFKKKKKEQPPAETAAPKGPQETPAPAPPTPPAATSSAAPATPPGSAPAVNVPPPPPAPGAPAGQAAMTPEEKQAFSAAVAAAQQADLAPDTSVAHIRERMARWRQVLILDPQNVAAQGALQQAGEELKAAGDRAAQAGKADQTTQDVIRSRLDAARKEIVAKNWGTAESHLAFVRSQAPTHPDLPVLEQELSKAKRLDDLKRQAMYIIPILVVLAAGLVVVVKFGAKYREQRQQKADELAAKRQAVLQIVDGVGRGRLVSIEKDKAIFKIGAATGPQDSDKNDLVISDSATAVSRYHCTLIRKDGDYYLVDASLNGTAVNGEAVKRGEHYLLEDGDEITVADVSRLKFLHA
jgi:hypothetical protein